MRMLIVVLLLFASCPSASAQKSPVKFGDIPMDDMTMTLYAPDSSASAVYLLDYEEAHIEERVDDYKLVTKVHIRIKILKADGKDLADVSILLTDLGSGNAEKVSNLKATTYNLENGKIVESPLIKESTFRQPFDKYRVFQKFTMPNVKVGSVIEYSYLITQRFRIGDFSEDNLFARLNSGQLPLQPGYMKNI